MPVDTVVSDAMKWWEERHAKGGRPLSPAKAMRQSDRISWQTLPAALICLAWRIEHEHDRDAAKYIADRCLGTPTARIESTVTTELVIDASQLQLALDRARSLVLQAQQAAALALPCPQAQNTAKGDAAVTVSNTVIG